MHIISNPFPLRRWLSAWCGTFSGAAAGWGCFAHGRRGGDPGKIMGKSPVNHGKSRNITSNSWDG